MWALVVRVANEHHRSPMEVASTYTIDDLLDLCEDAKRQNEKVKADRDKGKRRGASARRAVASGFDPKTVKQELVNSKPRPWWKVW